MPGKSFPLSVVITAIDKVTAPMRLMQQRINQITAGPRAVANRVTALSTAAGVPQVASGLSDVSDALGKVNTALNTALRRFAAIGAVATGGAFLFAKEFVGTADTFERLSISLEAIEGSAAKAGKSMAFLKDLTVKTPFELEDLSKAFRVMRGQGMDPMNGSLKAITDQVAKLGGTGEDLSGIAMQFGQAWGKARLQAQDANIMVERGVPVWGLLARGVERVTRGQKISVAELRKMSEAGQIGTKGITLLIEQMGIESVGASDRMMKSWSGMISNLRDNWTFFKLAVMDSGPFRALKAQLQAMLDTISRMAASGELQQWANRVGGAILTAFNWLKVEGPKIWDGLKAGLTSVLGVASTLADIFGGWGNLITVGLAAYIAGPLVASIVTLVATLMSANAALIGTPIGLLLLGGAAAVGFAAWQSQKMRQGWSGQSPQSSWNPAAPWLNPSSTALPPGALMPGSSSLNEAQWSAMRASLAARSAATVTIDIKNLPPGSRATVDPRSSTPVNLNTGYAFGEAH